MGLFHSDDDDKLLREILEQMVDNNTLLRHLFAESLAQKQLLQQIVDNTNPPSRFPTNFTLKETSMTQPDPGATLQFTATPQPAGSSLGTVVPSWTSSDTANVTITADPTGLVASIVLSASIPVGEVVTLTVSATDPATGTLSTGTAQFTVGAPPPPPPTFPTSFAVNQTA